MRGGATCNTVITVMHFYLVKSYSNYRDTRNILLLDQWRKRLRGFDGGRIAVEDGLRNTAIVNYGILTLVN